MRDALKPLDDFEMPDLWGQVRGRSPQGVDPGTPQRKRSRLATAAVAVAALVVIALVVSVLGPLGDQKEPTSGAAGPAVPIEARVAATIDLLTSPSAIAVGAGSVWVAAPAATGPLFNDSLVRIDPSTNKIVARIPLPGDYGSIQDIAANNTGVWVTTAERKSDQVVLNTFRVDLANNRFGPPIEGIGGQLAVEADAEWALSTGSDPTPTSIVRFDTGNGTVLSRTSLGGTGTDIVLGEGYAWVPLITHGAEVEAIAQVDEATNALVRTITLPGVSGTFEAPVVANGSLWIPVCCVDNQVSLYKVDPATGQASANPINIEQGIPFGSAYGKILSMSERGQLSSLDPETGSLNDLVQSDWPAGHGTMVYDDATSAVWVANSKSTVTRIDIRVMPSSSADDSSSEVPPQSVRVPDVLQLTVSQAKQQLVSRRLTVLVEHATSPDPVGTVSSQSPHPGSVVPTDTIVHVVVSDGLPGNDLGQLDCAPSQQSAIEIYPPTTVGPGVLVQTVPDLVRRTFSGIEAADQITASASEAGAQVAISRSGSTVARAFLTPHVGYWMIQEFSSCSTSGIEPPKGG